MVDINAPQLGIQAGAGAGIGFVVGFAAKKFIKLVAALLGLQMAFLAYLDNQGIVSVNWNQLKALSVTPAEATSQAQSVFDALIASIPLGGGFTIGTVAGFKKG